MIILVECCNELVVDWQGAYLDWRFTKIEEKLHKGLPVYKAKDSEMYLSISRTGFWVIKDDYLNEQPSAYKNNVRLSLIFM